MAEAVTVTAAMRVHMSFLDPRLQAMSGNSSSGAPQVSPNKAPRQRQRGTDSAGADATEVDLNLLDPAFLFMGDGEDADEDDDDSMAGDAAQVQALQNAYKLLMEMVGDEFKKVGVLGPKNTLLLGPGGTDKDNTERGIPNIYYGPGGPATGGDKNLLQLDVANLNKHFTGIPVEMLQKAKLYAPRVVTAFKRVQKPGLRYTHALRTWDVVRDKALKREFRARPLAIMYAMAGLNPEDPRWGIPSETECVAHMTAAAAAAPGGSGTGGTTLGGGPPVTPTEAGTPTGAA